MQLYTEQDFATTKKMLKRRIAEFAGIVLATIIAIVLFLTVFRNRIAVIAIAVIGGCLSYAFLTLKLMPWFRYWVYQNDMRHGMSRETDAWFVSCSDEARLADGVLFHEFIVRIGDEEEDERLFFWDDDKKRPEIKEGQRLHIRSFGNYITELQIEE